MTLLASCATDTYVNGIMCCQYQWHKVMLMPMPIVRYEKGLVAPSFHHLEIRNAMAPLTWQYVMPTSASATGIT